MSGFDKVVGSYEEAMAGLEDNMTVIAGGFGLCGIPENLIKEIRRKGARGLTVVSNNCGTDELRPGHAAARTSRFAKWSRPMWVKTHCSKLR